MKDNLYTESIMIASQNDQQELVLIVEDDEALCELLAEEVSDGGYEVETAPSAEAARRIMEHRDRKSVV